MYNSLICIVLSYIYIYIYILDSLISKIIFFLFSDLLLFLPVRKCIRINYGFLLTVYFLIMCIPGSLHLTETQFSMEYSSERIQPCKPATTTPRVAFVVYSFHVTA